MKVQHSFDGFHPTPLSSLSTPISTIAFK